jgi:hypothetical protein
MAIFSNRHRGAAIPGTAAGERQKTAPSSQEVRIWKRGDVWNDYGRILLGRLGRDRRTLPYWGEEGDITFPVDGYVSGEHLELNRLDGPPISST